MKVAWWWVLVGVVGTAAIVAGLFVLSSRDQCPAYNFVNSDFVCGDSWGVLDKHSYSEFEREMGLYIDELRSKGSVDGVSVYFRDLRGGPSFGYNINDTFAPASLLKLPIIIALLTIEEEESPGLLETKLRYDKAALDRQFNIQRQINFDFDGKTLVDGGEYTIRQLMRESIVYSDNYAYFALLKFINLDYPGGTAYVSKVLQELGVMDPRDVAEETVTVRNYAGLFRFLYNAAFLSPEDSEMVLSWLGESTFDEGLAAGFPASVVVASKFGEREIGENKSLYDCGIVYFPNNPYTLCVMTHGDDWQELKAAISTISHMVYEEVESRAK